MTTFIYAILIILPSIALSIMAFNAFKSHINGVSSKKIMRKNLISFAVVLIVSAALMFSVSAADATNTDTASADTAITAETEEAATEDGISKGMGLLAAGLVTGLAGIGGGIAVAAGAPAAIAATSEDHKSFGKSLIFVALGESIALYGVVISILIINKV